LNLGGCEEGAEGTANGISPKVALQVVHSADALADQHEFEVKEEVVDQAAGLICVLFANIFLAIVDVVSGDDVEHNWMARLVAGDEDVRVVDGHLTGATAAIGQVGPFPKVAGVVAVDQGVVEVGLIVGVIALAFGNEQLAIDNGRCAQ